MPCERGAFRKLPVWGDGGINDGMKDADGASISASTTPRKVSPHAEAAMFVRCGCEEGLETTSGRS
eukprot:3664807-Rhodomonas_salina.1